MFGWSMRARACRSASKRATTSRVSMPTLMILRATLRAPTGEKPVHDFFGKNTLAIVHQFGMEPGTGKGPVSLGRRLGEIHGFGGLRQRQAGKETELDQLGFFRVIAR